MKSLRQRPWLSFLSTTVTPHRRSTTAPPAVVDDSYETPLLLTMETIQKAQISFCPLCCEPFNAAASHVGKRSHVSISFVYQHLLKFRAQPNNRIQRSPSSFAGGAPSQRSGTQDVMGDRRWAPLSVRRGMETLLVGKKNKKSHSKTKNSGYRGNCYVEHAGSPLNSFFKAYEASDESLRRREEIVSLIHWFMRNPSRDPHHVNLLASLDDPTFFLPNIISGTQVLNRQIFRDLLLLLPQPSFKPGTSEDDLEGEKVVSCLTMMVTSVYNCECLFDLCRLEEIVPESVKKRFFQTNNNNSVEAATTTSLSPDDNGGEENREDHNNNNEETMGDAHSQGKADLVGPRMFKSNFVKALLGTLRWSVEESSVPPPKIFQNNNNNNNNNMNVAYNATLASHLVQLILSELIYLNFSELAVRSEWCLQELQEANQQRSPTTVVKDRYDHELEKIQEYMALLETMQRSKTTQVMSPRSRKAMDSARSEANESLSLDLTRRRRQITRSAAYYTSQNHLYMALPCFDDENIQNSKNNNNLQKERQKWRQQKVYTSIPSKQNYQLGARGEWEMLSQQFTEPGEAMHKPRLQRVL